MGSFRYQADRDAAVKRLESKRQGLIAMASNANRLYPQYRGYFDNMRIGVALETVTTKAGTAMESGETVLFMLDPHGLVSPDYVLVYSRTTNVMTSVPASAVKELRA